MPVTTDIAATYRGPGRVMRRLLKLGQREDRALAILMAGCGLLFVARWPALARQSHLDGSDLNMSLGGALLATLFILPLFLYAFAGVSHVVARALGGKGNYYGARLALFWALLASGPIVLLHGLVAGFIGPGPALNLVGFFWLALFLWFWLRGLAVAEEGEASA